MIKVHKLLLLKQTMSFKHNSCGHGFYIIKKELSLKKSMTRHTKIYHDSKHAHVTIRLKL